MVTQHEREELTYAFKRGAGSGSAKYGCLYRLKCRSEILRSKSTSNLLVGSTSRVGARLSSSSRTDPCLTLCPECCPRLEGSSI
jgi:hypothetical protein